MTEGPIGIAVALSALRAISRPARIDVLRCLLPRRMTVTEVAKRLRLRKSSAHAHLLILAQAGFVHRHEDKRAWVYYSLTEKGRGLVSTERPCLILLLSSAIVSLIGTVAFLTIWWWKKRSAPPSGSWSFPDITLDPHVEWGLLIAALVLLASLTTLTLTWRRLRRFRQFG